MRTRGSTFLSDLAHFPGLASRDRGSEIQANLRLVSNRIGERACLRRFSGLAYGALDCRIMLIIIVLEFCESQGRCGTRGAVRRTHGLNHAFTHQTCVGEQVFTTMSFDTGCAANILVPELTFTDALALCGIAQLGGGQVDLEFVFAEYALVVDHDSGIAGGGKIGLAVVFWQANPEHVRELFGLTVL